jgi:hypothetical protein
MVAGTAQRIRRTGWPVLKAVAQIQSSQDLLAKHRNVIRGSTVDDEDKEYSLISYLAARRCRGWIPDHGRVLTEKGRRRQRSRRAAKKAAGWVRVIASPAVRAQQTADALGRPYE